MAGIISVCLTCASIYAAEAKDKYGEENIKVYQSIFTPMYHSVTQRKVKALSKLICLLPEEKVTTNQSLRLLESQPLWQR